MVLQSGCQNRALGGTTLVVFGRGKSRFLVISGGWLGLGVGYVLFGGEDDGG